MSVSKTLLATAALAFLLPLSANAATESADFNVQLTVNNACTIAATGPVTFATVTGNITADIDATTNLSVNCNNGAIYTIGLEGDNASRTMVSGSDTVNYELFSDSTRTVEWGELASGDELGGTGSNSVQTIPVYARVPAGQSVPAGSYVDTVTATIEF